ncbi:MULTISPECIES: APC family permease [Microbacterium]|uniref:APC family permease n=1 Tax=Microbacterium TaxID=33882 RepID=UPI003D6A511A|nr:APC family permease [Microbacteriaceae bacterium K1510]
MTPHKTHSLEAGAVPLPGILMQAITHIGPAVGIIFSIQSITGVAGLASPFAFVVAAIAMSTVAVSVIQLSKKISSAGGYFTWVSQIIGPKSGFFTAWAFLLFEPIGAGINLSFVGGTLETSLQSAYGIDVPWWITAAIGGVLLTIISILGVKISVRVIVALGVFEILACVALAATGLAHPGPGGLSFAPFNPANATSFGGLFLGIVFSIFVFSGFEEVAPLAEESHEPKKNLPRAVILAFTIMGIFFLFTSWGFLVGWGTNNIDSFVASGSGVMELAHRLWGNGWILMLVALVVSVMGVGVAVQNASSRVIFGMARAGVLPAGLAKIDPKRRTPVNAVWLQSAITLVVALGGGALFGATGLIAFAAIIITLLIIVVYTFGNISVWRLYSRTYPKEYNRFTHLVIPIFSTAVLLFVGYNTLFPLPTGINGLAPIVAVVWLAIGLIFVAVLSRKDKNGWMLKAGEAMSPEITEENLDSTIITED